MSYVLDTKSTDTYQTLPCPGSRRVTLQISQAAILIGFGVGGGLGGTAPVFPPADEPFLPTVGSVIRECDAIRVKSYTPGAAADVKVIAQ